LAVVEGVLDSPWLAIHVQTTCKKAAASDPVWADGVCWYLALRACLGDQCDLHHKSPHGRPRNCFIDEGIGCALVLVSQ